MDTGLTQTEVLVEETRQLLNAVRGSSIKIGENLYNIKETLPSETNWGDFIRDEFDISESFASKLVTIHRVFVLEGGLSHAKLEGVDTEKLYLSRDLAGDIEEKLAKARTLTRSELKQTRNDEEPEPHAFARVCYCSVCGLSEERHP